MKTRSVNVKKLKKPRHSIRGNFRYWFFPTSIIASGWFYLLWNVDWFFFFLLKCFFFHFDGKNKKKVRKCLGKTQLIFIHELFMNLFSKLNFQTFFSFFKNFSDTKKFCSNNIVPHNDWKEEKKMLRNVFGKLSVTTWKRNFENF